MHRDIPRWERTRVKIEKLKLSLQEICEATGESTAVVYDAMNAGHLSTFLVGRRRFATPKAVQRWIDFLIAESEAGRPVCYRARSREQPAAAVVVPAVTRSRDVSEKRSKRRTA
jgi:hypothetical protein